MLIFTYFSQNSIGLFKLQNQITFVKTVILIQLGYLNYKTKLHLLKLLF